MRVIEQSYEIIRFHPEDEIYKIAHGYAQCYNKPIPETFEEQCEFIKRNRRHGSPLEHGNMTVHFVTNRGVTHELIRHRHTGYSQQSTRYCNYTQDRFDNMLTFIQDSSVINDPELMDIWYTARQVDEVEYFSRIRKGQKPGEARGGLPNDLATQIDVTTNLREWHDILSLRTSKAAHYQFRALMLPLLHEMKETLPCIFDDIPEE